VSSGFWAPNDRDVFVLPLTISPADFDTNGHVNNVVYVQWLQDIATRHWRERARADDRARWSWFARRHEIDYIRPLLPGDGAVARTWVGTPQGARFDRFVVIEGSDGAIRAQGRTEWVMVDATTHRPTRIRPEVLAPFTAQA
jgi:acyl-CoA thioester hydrolase